MKCIMLFIILLLVGCSFGSNDNEKITTTTTTTIKGQEKAYTKPVEDFPLQSGFYFGKPTENGIHNGVDYKAVYGKNVYSILDGVIYDSGEHNGFGSINPDTKGGAIIVKYQYKDKKFYVIYGHLVRKIRDVSFGGSPYTTVSKGQLIGTINNFKYEGTPSPHLHLGVYKGESFPSIGWGYGTTSNWDDPYAYFENNIK